MINYGRIYGAGLRFLQTLLLQYNPELGESRARGRAEQIVAATKGEKGWLLGEGGCQLVREVLGEDVTGTAFTRKQVSFVTFPPFAINTRN